MFFPNNMLALLWRILFLIILSYFLMPQMLWMSMLLRFYVVIEPYYVFLQVKQTISLFIWFIVLLQLMLLSLGQML